VANGTENMYACDLQRERLQGMLLTHSPVYLFRVSHERERLQGMLLTYCIMQTQK